MALCLCSGPMAASPPPAPGAVGQPFEHSRTFWRGGGHVGPAWFICDPMSSSEAIVVSLPDAHGKVSLVQPLSEDRPSRFKLGKPDPGAGQVYWPLSTPDGGEAGNLHSFNPGALTEPKDAATPTFTSIRVAGAQWSCRWLTRTRLMGFSVRRTVLITQADNGAFEYRTYDFKDAARAKRVEPDGAQQTTTASLDIKGGRQTRDGFEFRSGVIVYDVAASASGAKIEVRKNGKLALREPLIAWTIAPAP